MTKFVECASSPSADQHPSPSCELSQTAQPPPPPVVVEVDLGTIHKSILSPSKLVSPSCSNVTTSPKKTPSASPSKSHHYSPVASSAPKNADDCTGDLSPASDRAEDSWPSFYGLDNNSNSSLSNMTLFSNMLFSKIIESHQRSNKRSCDTSDSNLLYAYKHAADIS